MQPPSTPYSFNPFDGLINVQRHVCVVVDETTGILQQHVVLHTGDVMVAEQFHCIDTNEKEVREALVQLGWTPPVAGVAA